MVLPNRPLQSEKGSFILNTYRGSTCNDFFDRFLIELDKVLPAYDGTMGAESNVLPAHDDKKDRIIAMRLGLDRAAGVIVNQTVEGSPADKAGIRRASCCPPPTVWNRL